MATAFLDLAKAFDTVDHKILLRKLYNYGMRGKSYDLINSYLKNREQNVRIGSSVSNTKEINTGVPQGTILGPLLFILYINDMLKENTISYADDAAVIIIGNTWKEVQDRMNNELKSIAEWMMINKLSLNVDKSEYITFGSYA